MTEVPGLIFYLFLFSRDSVESTFSPFREISITYLSIVQMSDHL